MVDDGHHDLSHARPTHSTKSRMDMRGSFVGNYGCRYDRTTMTMLSPTVVRRPRPTLSTDAVTLREQAERLSGQPVPGVRLTERQFLAWHVEGVRAEWEAGEVVLMTMTSDEHSGLNVWLLRLVGDVVEHLDAGEVRGPEYGVRLPGQRRLRAPDVLFVARRRVPLMGRMVLDGAPDLAVEIVSPDSVERDWVTKRDEYERAGVREYWIVDPRHEHLAAYGLHGKAYRAIRPDDDGRIHSKVLKGLYIRPEWLWRSPLPKVAAVLRELGVR